ncbi:hypothetical protein V2J09_023213 [Rumex salicifolius]
MGRAPCCEKMGLKKGPWTPDEDLILISYIQQHGHSNWRALPKQAGLLRCGKSCRLRWVNYLKPDIKRGYFSPEEEESIIKLHEMLGNRWSAIAARLPGRTDNEIKNVWHTHLKKKLNNNNSNNNTEKKKIKKEESTENSNKVSEETNYFPAGSPQQSTATTEISSSITEGSSKEYFPEIDESFWTENPSTDNSGMVFDNVDRIEGFGSEYQVGLDQEMDFWFNVFIEAGGSKELPEF